MKGIGTRERKRDRGKEQYIQGSAKGHLRLTKHSLSKRLIPCRDSRDYHAKDKLSMKTELIGERAMHLAISTGLCNQLVQSLILGFLRALVLNKRDKREWMLIPK